MTASKIEQILNLSPLTLANGDRVYHGEEFICKIESVSSWRMKYVLTEDNLLTPINDFVHSIGGLPLFAWENSLEIDRVSHVIEQARIELDKSHEFVNELFKRAREIEL